MDARRDRPLRNRSGRPLPAEPAPFAHDLQSERLDRFDAAGPGARGAGLAQDALDPRPRALARDLDETELAERQHAAAGPILAELLLENGDQLRPARRVLH